jgi:hypothetical protein
MLPALHVPSALRPRTTHRPKSGRTRWSFDPTIIIVGLPDAAVQESRERVASAIKNAGLYFPRKRLTVNLAPAAVRKEGPAYDLPIALGTLIATGQLEHGCLDGSLVIGELSLDGALCVMCVACCPWLPWLASKASRASSPRPPLKPAVSRK